MNVRLYCAGNMWYLQFVFSGLLIGSYSSKSIALKEAKFNNWTII